MELYGIVLQSSRCIDFGNICQNSTNTRVLEFDNTIDKPVRISVQADCKELQSMNNVSVTIKPGETGALKLVLSNIDEATPRIFHRGLRYVINDQHSYDLLVDARVVSIALDVSPKQIVVPVGSFEEAIALVRFHMQPCSLRR